MCWLINSTTQMKLQNTQSRNKRLQTNLWGLQSSKKSETCNNVAKNIYSYFFSSCEQGPVLLLTAAYNIPHIRQRAWMGWKKENQMILNMQGWNYCYGNYPFSIEPVQVRLSGYKSFGLIFYRNKNGNTDWSLMAVACRY